MFKTYQNFTMRNQKWFLQRCSGFFIVNMKHVYSWVAVSTSDNDLVKPAGKDINI